MAHRAALLPNGHGPLPNAGGRTRTALAPSQPARAITDARRALFMSTFSGTARGTARH